jgi:hypothetical protein
VNGKRLTAIQAIRRFCLDCMGSVREPAEDVWGNTVAPTMEYAAVRNCPSEHTCPLWPYRTGRNPNVKPLSPELRQAKRDSLAQARAARAAR